MCCHFGGAGVQAAVVRLVAYFTHYGLTSDSCHHDAIYNQINTIDGMPYIGGMSAVVWTKPVPPTLLKHKMVHHGMV